MKKPKGKAAEPRIAAAAGLADVARDGSTNNLLKATSEAIATGLRDGLTMDSREMVDRVNAARAKFRDEIEQRAAKTAHAEGESVFKGAAGQKELRRLMRGPANLQDGSTAHNKDSHEEAAAKQQALRVVVQAVRGRLQAKKYKTDKARVVEHEVLRLIKKGEWTFGPVSDDYIRKYVL
jgi:hypothetical protein